MSANSDLQPECRYCHHNKKLLTACVLGLAAVILAVAGIVPKFSALLTTIPQCVLGGATVSVFASIAMTGMNWWLLRKWITAIPQSWVLQQRWE